MSIISNIKEKSHNNTLKLIEEEADNTYTIMDYKDQLFIGINGIPTILIGDDETAFLIKQKLRDLKQNFINFRKDDQHL